MAIPPDRLRAVYRSQTFTALIYSIEVFEERDVSLIVSVLITLNPDLATSIQLLFGHDIPSQIASAVLSGSQ
jgi:hypothetical protein